MPGGADGRRRGPREREARRRSRAARRACSRAARSSAAALAALSHRRDACRARWPPTRRASSRKQVAKLGGTARQGAATARWPRLPSRGSASGSPGAPSPTCAARSPAAVRASPSDATHGLGADCDLFDDDEDERELPGRRRRPGDDLCRRAPAKPAETPGHAGRRRHEPEAARPVRRRRLRPEPRELHPLPLRATRRRAQPDAILILVPGFEGGAGDFKILAENLIPRALAEQRPGARGVGVRPAHQPARGPRRASTSPRRRSTRSSRSTGSSAASSGSAPPALAAGPNRRAVFYDTQADVPFIANWTTLVFSRDIDAVVEAARAAAAEPERLPRRPLGRHRLHRALRGDRLRPDRRRAGGARLREAPRPRAARGRRRLDRRGAPLDDDTLDRIEAHFDGGLFGAVRDNAPRCVDGDDAVHHRDRGRRLRGLRAPSARRRRPPTPSFARAPQSALLAAGELIAIQAQHRPRRRAGDPPGRAGRRPGQQRDRAGAATWTSSASCPRATAQGAVGLFVDDEGLGAAQASFVATSVGAPGPAVDGLAHLARLARGGRLPALPRPGCVTRTTVRRRRRSRPKRLGRGEGGDRASTGSSPDPLRRRHELHRLVLPVVRALGHRRGCRPSTPRRSPSTRPSGAGAATSRT